jgi:hypothetical protein
LIFSLLIGAAATLHRILKRERWYRKWIGRKWYLVSPVVRGDKFFYTSKVSWTLFPDYENETVIEIEDCTKINE